MVIEYTSLRLPLQMLSKSSLQGFWNDYFLVDVRPTADWLAGRLSRGLPGWLTTGSLLGLDLAPGQQAQKEYWVHIFLAHIRLLYS